MKKNKKVVKAVCITLLAVAGLSAVAMISNQETGWANDLFKQDVKTSGLYHFETNTLISDMTSDKSTFKQEVELSGENTPFEKVTIDYKTYGGEDDVASVKVNEDVVEFSYIEEVTLTYTLAEDVEYNIGLIGLSFADFVDSEDEAKLDIEVRVDGYRFTCIDYSDVLLYLSEINPKCGDVEITIKNPYAKEKEVEAHTFALGSIEFNLLDVNQYEAE